MRGSRNQVSCDIFLMDYNRIKKSVSRMRWAPLMRLLHSCRRVCNESCCITLVLARFMTLDHVWFSRGPRLADHCHLGTWQKCRFLDSSQTCGSRSLGERPVHPPVILLYLSVRVPTLRGRWANDAPSPTTSTVSLARPMVYMLSVATLEL